MHDEQNQHTNDQHDHEAQDHCHHHALTEDSSGVLTIRSHSGLSGDMLLAGLLRMVEWDDNQLQEKLLAIHPDLSGAVRLVRKEICHIFGWHIDVTLPAQHIHRSFADIQAIIAASAMQEKSKELADNTFRLLATAEGKVHGIKPEEVHFHEVGALDSILDICLTCELFVCLNPAHLIVSPLPLADGSVYCAHGIIPVPAPAVLELLEDIPVRPFSGEGETVTPTALALLRSLGAEFGSWPAMKIKKQALVYGNTIFANAPNGAIFAWGKFF